MDKKKAAKIISLLISIFIVYIYIADCLADGIYAGCRLSCRFLYPFYHANLLHVALNVWCFLSVIFMYDISLFRLTLAYIIAISIPSFCLSDIPTVGLSGVVYALFGSISFEVQRKVYYQLWMFAYIILGFLSHNTNGWVHLYCYTAGVIIALLNKPIKIG